MVDKVLNIAERIGRVAEVIIGTAAGIAIVMFLGWLIGTMLGTVLG